MIARIQASFGHHDISGVKVHQGAQAQSAAQSIGARAYARGSDIAFNGSPSLHTAAHEAAHTVHQQAGVQLKGGVGVAGDKWEQHADAVADRVVQGRSATDLLDQVAGPGSGGGSVQAAVQREKEDIRQPLDKDATFEDLEAQAKEAQPYFSDIIDELIAKTGAITETYEKVKGHLKAVPVTVGKGMNKKTVNHYQKEYTKKQMPYSGMAEKLKEKPRSKQKAEGKYKGDYGRILDVVRGTLTFKDFAALIDGMWTVMDNEDLGYEVVRCKQTYTPVHMTLYGDIKMNIKEKVTGHICELQFTVKVFMDAKQKGHSPYRMMRNANPMGDDMKKVIGTGDKKKHGQAKWAVHGSYAAYLQAREAIEADGDLRKAIDTAIGIGKALEFMLPDKEPIDE